MPTVAGIELPLCVPLSIAHTCRVPLPVASASDEGHASATEIFTAQVPLRLHAVVQVPPLHVGEPASEVQAWPHVPQLLVVFNAVSQPFASIPSQSPKPLLHEGAQAPPEQLVEPLALVHATAQAPQWLVVEPRSTSHPSLAVPLQLANPPLHAPSWQVPAWHEAAALAKLHALPQKRQLAVDVSRLVSQPSPASLSQSPVPVAHEDIAHAPPWQMALPLSTTHAFMQALQLAGSDWRLVSQPSEALPLQSAKPLSQTGMHVPFAQLVVPCALTQAGEHVTSTSALVSSPPSSAIPVSGGGGGGSPASPASGTTVIRLAS
jgi:hypothetical protein